jgi:hypothetical protein
MGHASFNSDALRVNAGREQQRNQGDRTTLHKYLDTRRVQVVPNKERGVKSR